MVLRAKLRDTFTTADTRVIIIDNQRAIVNAIYNHNESYVQIKRKYMSFDAPKLHKITRLIIQFVNVQINNSAKLEDIHQYFEYKGKHVYYQNHTTWQDYKVKMVCRSAKCSVINLPLCTLCIVDYKTKCTPQKSGMRNIHVNKCYKTHGHKRISML